MDVASWLQDLGLGQYESVFAENAIDIDILPDLSEGDLEKLGIPLGHRKRLVKAIRALAAKGSITLWTLLLKEPPTKAICPCK